MIVAFLALAVLVVGAIALLAVYLGKRSAQGTGRTVLMCAGITAGLIVGGLLFDYTSVYYVRPIGWSILLVALAVAVVALVVLVVRAVGNTGRPLLALGGLIVLTLVLTAGFVGASQEFALMPYPWEARAWQVGQAAGFVPLLAHGRVPDDGYEPVSLLPRPETGIVMSYRDFQVQQRRARQVMDEPAMRAIAAVGKDPLRYGAPITSPVTYRKVTVGDKPALLVQWQPDIPGREFMTETVTMILFKSGSADVRVWSSQVDKPGAGGLQDVGMSPENLIDTAGTLQPMK